MALEVSELPRIFRYNSVELPDPGISHSAEEVRELYSATYPEIVNAAIEGPEEKDGKLVYTFRRAVGTKGADGPVAPCAHVWISNSGRGGAPEYRPNQQMAAEPHMHVMCRTCGSRTWFTQLQWEALPTSKTANAAR